MTHFAHTQNRIRHFAFLLFPLVLLTVFSVSCAAQSSATAPDDRTFQIQTANNVDQNLFPLYVLGNLYSHLPAANATGGEQSQWIASTRAQVQQMRSIIRSRQLDSALDTLYRDCLEFTSAYETFLEQSEHIKKQRSQYELSDALGGAIKGYRDGSDAETIAGKLGASKDNASSIGWIAGVLSGMGDIYSRDQQRDAAANSAIAVEARRLSDTWSVKSANAYTIAANLATRYGCRSEADFDNFSSGSAARYAGQMPRNPFASSDAALALKGDEHSDELMRRALRCFHAAEMVPADDAYADYRRLFVYESAALAVQAASVEAGNGAYSAGPVQSSGYAVQLTRTYLSLTSSDSGGSGNLLLARALGLAGRYADAVAADNRAFQIAPDNMNDLGVALRYAGLLSLTGYVDSAAQWLAKAYSLGLHDLAWVQQDPDLGNLRRLRPAVFAQLTSVKLTSPQFIWGFVWDDAQLRNDSKFDVTNLSVSVVVHKAGSSYSFKMQCPIVKAGGTCRADNVTSIPGDSYDNLQWSYSSDQGAS